MGETRTYGSPRAAAATIMWDIVTYGQSTGWHGSEACFQIVEEILNKFGVQYVDDMNGTWEYRGK